MLFLSIANEKINYYPKRLYPHICGYKRLYATTGQHCQD